MRVFISGICGFVGSRLALALVETANRSGTKIQVCGIDNLARAGSWVNLPALRSAGVNVAHGDVRILEDIGRFGDCDWVIDAAANASVIAGVTAGSPPRELVDVNLIGTLNQLEYCRKHAAGLILLSTSRVYSIASLSKLPMKSLSDRFELDPTQPLPEGVSRLGISEQFSTSAPISLYGATKLSAETLALEYMHAFQFPVWINRCGVMAGASQFGRAEQGIYSFWLHSWREQRPLKYIGFGGNGRQVRDLLHPHDLSRLVWQQLHDRQIDSAKPRLVNVSGGMASARSLSQLSAWCAARWGEQAVSSDPAVRPYDLPWIVLDHSLASATWGWQPAVDADAVLDEIAQFADANPNWLAGV